MSLRKSDSRPSIRLRRFPSDCSRSSEHLTPEIEPPQPTRRRSNSEPQRLHRGSLPHNGPQRSIARGASYMSNVSEEPSPLNLSTPPLLNPTTESSRVPLRSMRSYLAWKPLPPVPDTVTNNNYNGQGRSEREYESSLVDYLDLIDPEVQTLSTLTNVQNSLFVPDLGRFLNRRPTYNLSRRPSDILESDRSSGDEAANLAEAESATVLDRTSTIASITSRQSESHFAVLPHGVSLEGWSSEDRKELDSHVRHMLHSRRSKFKRRMRAFGQYVRRPLGFLVTLYATLITLFGLAWVLFLIGWINVRGRQLYVIMVIDYVLVALFAIMGDGLAPFRAVDTYHMIFLAHYYHKTLRLRHEKSLPQLQNHNDLPSVRETDVEAADRQDKDEFSVLSPLQQKRLNHHQTKFSKSHTFYKPHETTTHHAFPIRLLIAIVVLLDCHSILQISLGICTWGIDYRRRPFALTTVILCCSITVNITAGILISVGDHRTRKKDVLEKMHRQELTAEAMERLQRRKEKEESKYNRVDGIETSLPRSSTGIL